MILLCFLSRARGGRLSDGASLRDTCASSESQFDSRRTGRARRPQHAIRRAARGLKQPHSARRSGWLARARSTRARPPGTPPRSVSRGTDSCVRKSWMDRSAGQSGSDAFQVPVVPLRHFRASVSFAWASSTARAAGSDSGAPRSVGSPRYASICAQCNSHCHCSVLKALVG